MATPNDGRAELESLRIDRDRPARRGRVSRSPWWVRWLVWLAILGVAAFLFRGRVAALVADAGLPSVKVHHVVERSAAAVAAATGTSANGYVVAKTRAALSADTPGRIVEMNVQEGSVVKKGDVVARLYSDEYAAALRRAESDLEVEKAAAANAEAQIVTAEKELDALKGRVSAAETDVATVQASVTLAQLSFDRAEQLLQQQVGNADSRDRARKDLDEAKARLASAQAGVSTAKLDALAGEARLAAARTAVAQYAKRVESATAARDLARATLEKTQVRAPFDGIVVLKDAEVGEVVSPNGQGGSNARGSIVTMVDFATLEVEAEVAETTLAAVTLGAEANLYLDAYPDKAYRGRVDRIWPTANRTKATVEVRVAFLERDDRLRPEMGVRVVFGKGPGEKERPLESRILVPSEALVKTDGKLGVFVVERGVVHWRDVQRGGERAGKIAILAGVAPGDDVVLAPDAKLVDGARVKVESSGS